MKHLLTDADSSPPQTLGSGPWRRSQLVPDIGSCFTDFLHIDTGLTLVYTDYCPNIDLQHRSVQERDHRVLTLSVGLEGCSNTLGVDRQQFNFCSGFATVTSFASVCGERHFTGGETTRQLRLIVDEALVYKYQLDPLLANTTNDKSARHIFYGRYNPAIQRLANNLVRLHDRAGGILEAQVAALSLLMEQVRPLLPNAKSGRVLMSTDQDKCLQARTILLENYDQPLTVGYLCAAVGTNEFTLKEGFRRYFGTSPHRLLTEIRMQKAWQLLEEGQQASCVGYRVGYQHPSSFSSAFRKYYGQTPMSVTKTGRE